MITTPSERIEEYTRQGWWDDTTLHALLWRNSAAHPDRLAVADQPNREALTGHAPLRLNYAQLRSASTNLACRLLDRGVGQGDALLVQLPNVSELFVLYFAASAIGAIVSPLAVQYGRHEIAKAADVLSPAAMITIDRVNEAPLADNARAAMPADVPVLVFGANAAGQADGLEIEPDHDAENEARLSQYQAEHPPNANATLTICWTSGTTGTPKGVPRSHNMWFAIGRNSAEAAAISDGDRMLNPFPLVNMGALGGFVFPGMLHACSVVLHQPFDPPVFLQQLQQEKINFTIAPPAVLNHLAKAEELWNQFDFSALRSIGSGSAPLSPWMIQTFGEKYGKEIVNFYGSNEGISLYATPDTAPDPETRASMFPRLGCENMPWKGVAHRMVGTRVVVPDSEEDITEPGVPGELLFAGPTIFDGYLGTPNEGVFTSDGWFRTGDLVEICGEPPNFYRIVGRCKDIINRGGMKISPAEIDILLEGYPGIQEGAVCAYSDERLGEKVCACVVPLPDGEPPELERINAFLLEKGLAKFKLPERLMALESLPRNPMNKVMRSELEQMVKEDA
jgi:acyl-CoA synthetase (AMP-forming)/AMP-acid ligase II